MVGLSKNECFIFRWKTICQSNLLAELATQRINMTRISQKALFKTNCWLVIYQISIERHKLSIGKLTRHKKTIFSCGVCVYVWRTYTNNKNHWCLWQIVIEPNHHWKRWNCWYIQRLCAIELSVCMLRISITFISIQGARPKTNVCISNGSRCVQNQR